MKFGACERCGRVGVWARGVHVGVTPCKFFYMSGFVCYRLGIADPWA